MAISWGNEYSTQKNFSFKLGLNITTEQTDTNICAKVEVWFHSQYELYDSQINLFYREGQNVNEAYDEKHTYLVNSKVNVSCPNNEGSGWAEVNKVKIHTASHTFPREAKEKTINICAQIGSVYGYSSDVGGVITVVRSVVVPALPNYTITFNANGGTVTQTLDKKTHGINLTLPVPTRTGHTFLGWALSKADADSGKWYYAPNQECRANQDLDLYAVWQINQYTNTIQHWAYGWKNGEGNNGTKDSFELDEDTFAWAYNSNFSLSASRGTTIPNGFYLANVGTLSVTGSWKIYEIGSAITQQSKAMVFQYFYHLHQYTITYNLNGGSFDTTPPTTYNVLYQVLFPTPKREGYIFDGWFVDGYDRPVSGVNVGANGAFASAEELYRELAKRTTGNVAVTAKWRSAGAVHVKKDNAWKKGQLWFKEAGTWKRGIPWFKVNREWKKGGA